MLRFSGKKGGEAAQRRFPEPLLELTQDEAMELSKAGGARRVSEFLAKGAVREGNASIVRDLPGGLQDALCDRLERASRGGAIMRLLMPLSLPCILGFAERALREIHPLGISIYGMAAIFGGAIVASAVWGGRLASSYERKMSGKACALIEDGRVTSALAQGHLSFIIAEAKDSLGAFRLLKEGKIADECAAVRLAGTVYSHGSEEHARELAGNDAIPGAARELLMLRCR